MLTELSDNVAPSHYGSKYTHMCILQQTSTCETVPWIASFSPLFCTAPLSKNNSSKNPQFFLHSIFFFSTWHLAALRCQEIVTYFRDKHFTKILCPNCSFGISGMLHRSTASSWEAKVTYIIDPIVSRRVREMETLKVHKILCCYSVLVFAFICTIFQKFSSFICLGHLFPLKEFNPCLSDLFFKYLAAFKMWCFIVAYLISKLLLGVVSSTGLSAFSPCWLNPFNYDW